MNSQDKPIDVNEHLDESLEISDVVETSENSVDLWSDNDNDAEIVTEFISEEAAAKNDAEVLETIASENVAQPKNHQKNNDLDLDNWDFRNIQDESSITSEPRDDKKSEEDLDDLTVEEVSQTEFFVEETLDSSDLEINNLEELEEIEPAAEFSFNDGLDESVLDLDDSVELAELGEEPVAELSLSDGLDGSLELEIDNLEELAELGEDPVAELSLGDGLDESVLDLDDSVELAELSEDSVAEFNLDDGLDGSLELEIDNLEELAELGEDPAVELSLGDGLNEPVLDLDDSVELAELGDLEPLEALDGEDDDLDSLIGLDLESDSLDSLVIESTDSPDLSLTSWGTELNSLDSLLEDELAVSPRPDLPNIPEPTQNIVASSPTSAMAKAQTFEQTMRVSVRKLDDLNNLIGELVVKRNRLEDDQERLRRFLDNLLNHVQSLGEAGAKMHDMYERSLLEGALMASRQSRANAAVAIGASGGDLQSQDEGLDALEMDRFTGFHLLSQEIIELIVRVREAASDIQFVVDETDKVTQTFRQVTSQLQDGMNSSRMVAFGQTADRLPRAVRDISRKQKKQTKLHVEGKDVSIDKMIVENLYNPMTHLVNNAISHGIEIPEERLKKGKPETGNVYIKAFIQGNQTVITVKDDGAGIDPEKVKQKAIEKNLITWANAQNLSEQEVYEFLFHPGFSTKEQADDFAGRGVGMDVVNTDLKKIRGSISTESAVGKGTTFTIRLPLVLSICKALICMDDNNTIAFPIDGVEDTKEYLPSDIKTNQNGVRCITWNNALLPIRPLGSLLNYNRQIGRAGYNTSQNNDDTVAVVILRSLDNLLAVEVDEIRAEQEIVIKQIDGPVAKPPGIAGATVLGDGTILPIGDVLELIEIAQGKRTIEIGFNILAGEGAVKQAQAENAQQEPMVLVVDDSITVRELLTMSFNKLGYRVEQARDGQEAWDKLSGGLVCDMIFSDIEMPRMNGLELLSHLHQDEKLKSIPVAMLTSRGADKHRQIANDLGARAYLTKPYTEKDLMDVAQRLIEINRANKEAESVTVNLNKIKKHQSAIEVKDAPSVLIIDDSVTVRELLSMSFKNAGYRVEQARDGQEAWEKLKEGLECDIAFCDIEMPRMNGLELLAQLQKDEKLATLPIAMLTSRGAQKMRNIAASRGANGYFVKPYVEDELLKAAKRMINGEILIESSDENN